MTDPGHNSDAQLRDLVDRILRAREEEDTAKEFTKEIYAEAKGAGYDKAALGAVVAKLRALAKDPDKVAEREATYALYLEAYQNAAPRALVGARTREDA